IKVRKANRQYHDENGNTTMRMQDSKALIAS
uniref:Uncharacterized protein n=1 Tax=Acrobeloides nanus TaxID=290746 RepID=A0A914D2Z3_9BILA